MDVAGGGILRSLTHQMEGHAGDGCLAHGLPADDPPTSLISLVRANNARVTKVRVVVEECRQRDREVAPKMVATLPLLRPDEPIVMTPQEIEHPL